MGLFNRLYSLLITLTFVIPSYAKFLVEPGFNAYSGQFKVAEEAGDFQGNTFGLNLGYLGANFMIGLSFETGKYSYDKNVTDNNTSKFDGGGVGGFVGFYFWDRIKVWTGYLNSTLEPVNNNNERYFGQHVSYGLGYRLLDGLMLNIYEFKNQFTQLESDITGKTGGLENVIKTRGAQVSLSYILLFN